MNRIIEPPPDPQRVRQLGREMTMLVHRYVRPLLFGDAPPFSNESLTVNGAITFVKTHKRCFGITNYHVLKHFREMKALRAKVHCQLDEMIFNPDERLIDEDISLDIATVHISESEIASIGATAFSPVHWPPSEPSIGEFAVSVGYPGWLRYLDSPLQIAVTYIGVASPITSVDDARIELEFSRQYWITEVGSIDPSTIKNFGGFSGSGLFVMRLAAELVGIVFGYWPTYDLLHCTRTDLIEADGTIKHFSVKTDGI